MQIRIRYPEVEADETDAEWAPIAGMCVAHFEDAGLAGLLVFALPDHC